MPQPTPYNRSFSFTDFQASSPSAPLPGYRVDAQLDGIAQTLGGVLGNLLLIQRDDGKLADGTVTVDAIDADALEAIAEEAAQIAGGHPNFTFVANTLAPGAAATVAVAGVYPNLTVTLGIPKGNPAIAGAAVIDDGIYGNITVEGGGSVFRLTSLIVADVPELAAALAAKAGLAELNRFTYGGPEPQAIFLTPNNGTTGAIRVKANAASGKAIIQLTNNDETAEYGVIFADAAGITIVGDLKVTSPAGGDDDQSVATTAFVQDIADALTAALAGKQPIGAYATVAQLAGKADAFTDVESFADNIAVNDTHNGLYWRLTGGVSKTVTFATPTVGMCAIYVNRSTVNWTIACAGGYYKNGAAAPSVVNFNLTPGQKLTAFHEGGGVWTFDVTGS